MQAEKKPSFDRIFISLGFFHIEIIFFSAIGKVIAESGGLYILSECYVFVKGSVWLFLSVNITTDTRLHEILSLAMEILHLNFFVTTLNDDQIDTCKSIKGLNHCNEKEEVDVDTVINLHILFTGKIRQGLHGKTAEFWIYYFDKMQVYHAFSQNQRIDDFGLFLACFS